METPISIMASAIARLPMKVSVSLEIWLVSDGKKYVSPNRNGIFIPSCGSLGVQRCCTSVFYECLQHHRHKKDCRMTFKTCGFLDEEIRIN